MASRTRSSSLKVTARPNPAGFFRSAPTVQQRTPEMSVTYDIKQVTRYVLIRSDGAKTSDVAEFRRRDEAENMLIAMGGKVECLAPGELAKPWVSVISREAFEAIVQAASYEAANAIARKALAE